MCSTCGVFPQRILKFTSRTARKRTEGLFFETFSRPFKQYLNSIGFDSIAEEAFGSPLRHADVQLSPGTELGAGYDGGHFWTCLF